MLLWIGIALLVISALFYLLWYYYRYEQDNIIDTIEVPQNLQYLYVPFKLDKPSRINIELQRIEGGYKASIEPFYGYYPPKSERGYRIPCIKLGTESKTSLSQNFEPGTYALRFERPEHGIAVKAKFIIKIFSQQPVLQELSTRILLIGVPVLVTGIALFSQNL